MTLSVLEGGALVSPDMADAEWRSAWTRIARACEEGLSELHPLHPRRDLLLALTRDARLAAQLPAEPQLTLSGGFVAPSTMQSHV